MNKQLYEVKDRPIPTAIDQVTQGTTYYHAEATQLPCVMWLAEQVITQYDDDACGHADNRERNWHT